MGRFLISWSLRPGLHSGTQSGLACSSSSSHHEWHLNVNQVWAALGGRGQICPSGTGRLCELVHLPSGRLIVSWAGLLVRGKSEDCLCLLASPGSPYRPPLPAFSQFFPLFLPHAGCLSLTSSDFVWGMDSLLAPLNPYISIFNLLHTFASASLRFENFPVQAKPLRSDF